MGILNRITREPRDPDASRVATSIRTLAGVAITPDSAVTIATVWACLRYLSQTVAVLPWHVLRLGQRGAEIASSHPIDWMLWKRVSAEWSSMQFRETLVHWALRWGNGYAEIERDQLNRPFALWPIHPDRVEVCRATEAAVSDSGTPINLGDLFYEVSNGLGGKVTIASRDMFHLRGFGEGPVGVNVIHYASQSLGWARAAQLFGASFFGNGANLAGIVINKKPLSPAGLVRQRAEFDQLYKGVRNAHKTAHLDNEADWKAIGIDPEKSQLIETHQLLIEEICRWFGVPPHKVMHLLRATFSNIEHQAIEVVVDSITPWAKRLEDEADYKLFGDNRRGFYSKINLNGLMRGDSKARVEFYKGMRDIGAYNVNRILELEDENTIGPDGDKHTMQSGFTTLKRIGEEPVKVLPAPAKAATGDDEADQAAVDRVAALVNSDMRVIEHVR
jgi:HK97 family phage portal protein